MGATAMLMHETKSK